MRGCQLSCGFAPISHWVAVIIVVAAVDVAAAAAGAVSASAVAASLLVDTSVTLSHAFSPGKRTRRLCTAHCLHAHQHSRAQPRTPKHLHTQTYALLASKV